MTSLLRPDVDTARFVEHLRAGAQHGELVHVQQIAERSASYAELEHGLASGVESALSSRGLLPLYSHQAAAVDAVMGGRDVAVVTPTASGKSLCYHIPVAQSLLARSPERALYLFPTKALTQDQVRGLRELLPPRLASKAAIFDGDTPQGERSGIRRTAEAIFTNPDMLHLGILPNHSRWAPLLRSLRYVVIDEMHIYRGVFGSHVANVIRRLRRLCAHYGSDPVFILCSATIANPGELAEGLIGRPVEVIEEDGAPQGRRHFVFWNPPIIDENGARAGAGTASSAMLEMLVRRGARALVFVRTRRQAEVVYTRTRDRLAENDKPLAERIRPYRGTYLAEERRAVEQGMLNGELLGVVATNALELGIDIGGLDTTVLTGYPGSVASTWQQAGRSGRGEDDALSVLVARDDPLDQYLMHHPEFVFGRTHEHARIHFGNPHVLGPHLKAAAYEMPLRPRDGALFGEGFEPQVAALTAEGSLEAHGERWHISPSVDYPAQHVNIRSTAHTEYLAVESQSGRILEHVDEHAAFSQLHPGAVYLHLGDSYVVESLDLDARAAYLSRNRAPYYTDARVMTDIRITDTRATKELNGATVCLGEVEVTRQVVGFYKRDFYTANQGDVPAVVTPLNLPPHHFSTVAVWFDLPTALFNQALRERVDLPGGLHAMEHAAIGVLPLFALCDRNDIGGVSTALHPDTGAPQVFIYDGHPGGVGIAEHGYKVIRELLTATLDAVSECPCKDGCPSCIQSPKCGNNNSPLDKRVASDLLAVLTGRG